PRQRAQRRAAPPRPLVTGRAGRRPGRRLRDPRRPGRHRLAPTEWEPAAPRIRLLRRLRVHVGGGRPGPVHGEPRRRDHPRFDPGRPVGPDGGGQRVGVDQLPALPLRRLAPGDADRHTAADQPGAQPDQEHLPGRRRRLRRDHHADADVDRERAARRAVDRHPDARLPRLLAPDIPDPQHRQSSSAAGDEMTASTLKPSTLPSATTSPLAWVRSRLFPNVRSGILTIVLAPLLVYAAYRAALFLFVNGRWEAVTRNLTLFMQGTYPRDQQWRIVAQIVVLAL